MNSYIQQGQGIFINNVKKINKKLLKFGGDACIYGGGLCDGCEMCIRTYEEDMWDEEVACY